MKVFWNTAA